MRLSTIVNKTSVSIDLEGVSEETYKEVGIRLSKALQQPKVKNREAISDAFIYAVRQCPSANASDLWHHVVYRQYCDIFNKHRPEDPKQSWVRASGDALEGFLQKWYTPVLKHERVRIQALIGAVEKRQTLETMGLSKTVGQGKLDVALYAERNGKYELFGGVHVKASLAERVSDDVPASRAMMERGYFSPLWTLDVKSFPPPHGDLVNRGELGSPTNPSEKRKYIEEHGEFDDCFSANARTQPSIEKTPSGKRIYTISLGEQPDDFAKCVIARVKTWRSGKR
jgi:hypothetical protein